MARPEVLTDSQAAVVWRAQLEAFYCTVLVSTISDFNIGFPGQYWDKEKQSWYNYFRDYDATTGRYMQSDPIGLAGGINTYGYVGGNPLLYADPLGLARWTGRLEMLSGGMVGGGAIGRAVLTSDCVDGQRWNVKVSVKAVGATGGIPWSLTASKIELYDPYPTAKPINLIGDFSYSGFGLAATIGYSISTIQIGQAYSTSSGLLTGIDASWSDFTMGEASVTDASQSACGCGK